MIKKLYGPFISLGIVLISLVVLEIGLWVFAPIDDPYHGVKLLGINRFIGSDYSANLVAFTQAEEGLPGLGGKKRFSTNNYGFRGEEMVLPKPDDEYRVFIIGGSTTECLYLDDSESVDRTLQDALAKNNPGSKKIKVYGAGKSGDRSDHHISMLVHRVTQMQPDMVIVFAGMNDLSASIFNHDYLHRGSNTRVSRFIMFRIFSTEFQIPRYLYRAAENVIPEYRGRRVLESLTLESNYKSKIELRKNAPITDKVPVLKKEEYRNNLKTLAGVAKGHGFKMIFMTQASTWNSKVDPDAKNWHWMTYRDGATYKEEVMDKSLEEMNDVMREVGVELTIPVYDLARNIPKSTEYFYNDIHFNVTGARKAGEDLGKFILETGLIN